VRRHVSPPGEILTSLALVVVVQYTTVLVCTTYLHIERMYSCT
jgi:hypothetical protein